MAHSRFKLPLRAARVAPLRWRLRHWLILRWEIYVHYSSCLISSAWLLLELVFGLIHCAVTSALAAPCWLLPLRLASQPPHSSIWIRPARGFILGIEPGGHRSEPRTSFFVFPQPMRFVLRRPSLRWLAWVAASCSPCRRRLPLLGLLILIFTSTPGNGVISSLPSDLFIAGCAALPCVSQ